MHHPAKVVGRWIEVSADFRALHSWPGAPSKGAHSGMDLSFLREVHRHLFKVTVKFEVHHGNRDLEFFDVQSVFLSIVRGLEGSVSHSSCEMYAEFIGLELDARGITPYQVAVSEDGENRAIVQFAKGY